MANEFDIFWEPRIDYVGKLCNEVSVRRDTMTKIKNYVQYECKKYKLMMQRTKKAGQPKRERYATYYYIVFISDTSILWNYKTNMSHGQVTSIEGFQCSYSGNLACIRTNFFFENRSKKSSGLKEE